TSFCPPIILLTSGKQNDGWAECLAIGGGKTSDLIPPMAKPPHGWQSRSTEEDRSGNDALICWQPSKYEVVLGQVLKADFAPLFPQHKPLVLRHFAKSKPKIFSPKQNFRRLQSRGGEITHQFELCRYQCL
ncbi:MAG: hypothetical protein ACKV2Q_31165, partial [Planctomycetaceae bacterium]